MALISIQKISDDVLLGLWRIEETIEDFYSRYPFLQVYRKELEEKYKFEGRQKEFLSIREGNPLFDEVREAGGIGIPCILRPDGSITLDWESCM